jgi:hypothetical protein
MENPPGTNLSHVVYAARKSAYHEKIENPGRYDVSLTRIYTFISSE